MGKEIKLRPIGIIHTPFKSRKETPILSSRSKAIGKVEIYKEYQQGLKDIDGFSHIILVFLVS